MVGTVTAMYGPQATANAVGIVRELASCEHTHAKERLALSVKWHELLSTHEWCGNCDDWAVNCLCDEDDVYHYGEAQTPGDNS